MSALKKTNGVAETITSTPQLREADEFDTQNAAPSPVLELHQALHDAGYRRSGITSSRMSNTMLVLSLTCVYVFSMLMMVGSLTA